MPYSLLVRLAASLLLLAASACQRDRVRGLDADASAPETLDFGLLAVGERKELLLEVSNTSVVSLSVQGAEVARPFAAEVAAAAAEVGGSARLKISFAPQAEGQAEATVTVSLSSPRTPSLAVRLKGAAYRPALSVSAARLDFGDVKVGESKRLEFEIANAAPASVAVSAILDASGSSSFSASPSGALVPLAPQAKLKIAAVFAPGKVGVASGAIAITCAGCGPRRVELVGNGTGTATTPAPATLSVTPDHLSFLAQLPAVAAAQQLTLTNGGDLGLQWSASVDGAELQLSATAGALAGHTTAQIAVSLGPGAIASGIRHVTITAKAAAAITPLVVPIDITALGAPGPAALRVDPRTLAFTSLLPTLPLAQTITVRNVGQSQLHFVVAAGAPGWLSATPASGTLLPNQFATVSVRVTAAPRLPSTLSQTLTVASPEATTQDVAVTAAFLPPAPPAQYGGSVWPKFHQGNTCTGLSSVPTKTRGVVRFKSRFGAARLGSMDGTYVGSPVIADDGTIYQVGGETFDGSVSAFEPLHGVRRWSTVITNPASISPSIEATPTVVKDGSIFVMTGAESASTHFYKLNRAGHIVWSDADVRGYGDGFDSSPAIGADGTMWLAFDEAPAVLLFSQGDATSPPHEIGRVPVESGSDIEAQSGAIGDDGTAYWADDGKLEVMAKDGRLWRHDATDGNDFQWIHSRSAPLLTLDGAVVFAYANTDFHTGEVHTVITAVTAGRATGQRLWRTTLGPTAPVVPLGPTDSLALDDRLGLSSPALGPDGTIYIGHADGLYALDRGTGVVKWHAGTALVSSSPAVGADGTIFFGSADGKIRAVDPQNTPLWSVPTGGPVNSSPAIGADGAVFVASDDGYLYGIE